MGVSLRGCFCVIPSVKACGFASSLGEGASGAAGNFVLWLESLRQYPLSHGLRRASSPKGAPFGTAGKFAATTKAVPLGKVAANEVSRRKGYA